LPRANFGSEIREPISGDYTQFLGFNTGRIHLMQIWLTWGHSQPFADMIGPGTINCIDDIEFRRPTCHTPSFSLYQV
jgi:hypothetical protein